MWSWHFNVISDNNVFVEMARISQKSKCGSVKGISIKPKDWDLYIVHLHINKLDCAMRISYEEN